MKTKMKTTEQFRTETIELAKELHREGTYSTKALVFSFFAIRINRDKGWTVKLNNKQIYEFLGISESSFYRAVAALRLDGRLHWRTDGLTEYALDPFDVAERKRKGNPNPDSQLPDVTEQFIDIGGSRLPDVKDHLADVKEGSVRCEGPSCKSGRETSLKPLVGAGSGNPSYSSQISFKSSSSIKSENSKNANSDEEEEGVKESFFSEEKAETDDDDDDGVKEVLGPVELKKPDPTAGLKKRFPDSIFFNVPKSAPIPLHKPQKANVANESNQDNDGDLARISYGDLHEVSDRVIDVVAQEVIGPTKTTPEKPVKKKYDYKVEIGRLEGLLKEFSDDRQEWIEFFEWADGHLWPTFNEPIKNQISWLKSKDDEGMTRLEINWINFSSFKRNGISHQCLNVQDAWKRAVEVARNCSDFKWDTLIRLVDPEQEPRLHKAIKDCGGLSKIARADNQFELPAIKQKFVESYKNFSAN